TAIPDLASFALMHRVFPMLAAHGGEAWERLLKLPADTDFRSFLSATELAHHGALLSRRLHNEDAFFTRESHGDGIGTPGTLKNTVTSAIGGGTTWLSNMVGKFSGLSHWDRFWKIASGLQMADDLRDMVRRYGKLSDLERTHLASLGISEAEAGRLQRYFT